VVSRTRCAYLPRTSVPKSERLYSGRRSSVALRLALFIDLGANPEPHEPVCRFDRESPVTRPMGVTGTTPGSPGTRGESERRGLTSCVVTKGCLSKVIEPAGVNIPLDLAVPRRPVLDFLLGLLHLTHGPLTANRV